MGLLLALLIFIGLFIFFYAGRSQERPKSVGLPQGYLTGLNFLLNEQPDKAVDIFIKMLDVDETTVETHLALGNLFRRRGEFDRAIRVHQNVIARPQLSHQMRVLALVALGEDYLSAGVLDRAERVFQEVITLDPQSSAALFHLLDIYQQEKEWQKAIAIAEKLPDKRNGHYQPRVAHYYCEIAEFALSRQDLHQAQLYLKEALVRDPDCLRAYLIQADYFIHQASYEQAIKSLKKVHSLNSSFLSETMARLEKCYEALGDSSALIEYLKTMLKDVRHVAILPILIKISSSAMDRQYLEDYIKESLQEAPSLEALSVYIELVGGCELSILESTLARIKKRDPAYQCQQCGYAGNIFQWQCPSCKRWGEVYPCPKNH
jgi:lipopolysaccharide biosynthesis regulator YciM